MEILDTPPFQAVFFVVAAVVWPAACSGSDNTAFPATVAGDLVRVGRRGDTVELTRAATTVPSHPSTADLTREVRGFAGHGRRLLCALAVIACDVPCYCGAQVRSSQLTAAYFGSETSPTGEGDMEMRAATFQHLWPVACIDNYNIVFSATSEGDKEIGFADVQLMGAETNVLVLHARVESFISGTNPGNYSSCWWDWLTYVLQKATVNHSRMILPSHLGNTVVPITIIVYRFLPAFGRWARYSKPIGRGGWALVVHSKRRVTVDGTPSLFCPDDYEAPHLQGSVEDQSFCSECLSSHLGVMQPGVRCRLIYVEEEIIASVVISPRRENGTVNALPTRITISRAKKLCKQYAVERTLWELNTESLRPNNDLEYSPPPKANRVRFLAGSPADFRTWESVDWQTAVAGASLLVYATGVRGISDGSASVFVTVLRLNKRLSDEVAGPYQLLELYSGIAEVRERERAKQRERERERNKERERATSSAPPIGFSSSGEKTTMSLGPLHEGRRTRGREKKVEYKRKKNWEDPIKSSMMECLNGKLKPRWTLSETNEGAGRDSVLADRMATDVLTDNMADYILADKMADWSSANVGPLLPGKGNNWTVVRKVQIRLPTCQLSVVGASQPGKEVPQCILTGSLKKRPPKEDFKLFNVVKVLHVSSVTTNTRKLSPEAYRMPWETLLKARLHHRGSKLDLRSYLRSTQKTVAPSEFRAGLEIEIKFISNRRNWWFEISIRDQQPSSWLLAQQVRGGTHFVLRSRFILRRRASSDVVYVLFRSGHADVISGLRSGINTMACKMCSHPLHPTQQSTRPRPLSEQAIGEGRAIMDHLRNTVAGNRRTPIKSTGQQQRSPSTENYTRRQRTEFDKVREARYFGGALQLRHSVPTCAKRLENGAATECNREGKPEYREKTHCPMATSIKTRPHTPY
ncbi:hypothetical protein PR048_000738 [Dryococelus australis]|uniref:Uncharacterized protein n=1 Tax=Dryococelus australis TaxID=614101 RepID=A0ABQ9IFH3_9NEOP|nr:hypothetical protein PR048_000738 [Dryococelus australis]